ncbi:hypothetical protein M426DRAFT_322405 [Hypoxylon sp. CI-4A]|nr:hypothetical protein M426DRAFT_322405 [Hypoxylon sp. CI-4A]
MDAQAIHPVRSAEIPILGETAKRIVEGLDEGRCLHDLFPLVVDLAQQLRQQQYANPDRIIDSFEDHEKGGSYEKLRILFHTIPRDTLRSLVLGTTSLDFHNREHAVWDRVYSSRGAGSYLIGIAIKGRDGAFLNCDEIRSVIQLMGVYRVGCDTWDRDVQDTYGHKDLAGPDIDALVETMKIDNELIRDPSKRWMDDVSDSESPSQSDSQSKSRSESESESQSPSQSDTQESRARDDFRKPKFARSSTRDITRHIRELISMLQRRIDLGFDDTVPQKISPVYVGCSHKMIKRLPGHDPDLSSMETSSNALSLLLACIKHIGLIPMAIGLPVVPAWEEPQIPLAEMLVTVLAQSLVSLNGLNVIKPRTSTPMDDEIHAPLFDSTFEHVLDHRPWFAQNMQDSLDFLENRDIPKNLLQRIAEEFPPDDLRSAIEKYEELKGNDDELNAKLVKVIEKAEARLEKQKARLAELQTLLEFWDHALPPKDMLLGNNGGNGGEDAGEGGENEGGDGEDGEGEEEA